LYERIRSEFPDIEVEIVKVSKKNRPDNNPKYDEISRSNEDSFGLKRLNKQIGKLEGTIRVKLRKNSEADIKKEESKLKELKRKKQTLSTKRWLQQVIIEPLLLRRMICLDNLLKKQMTEEEGRSDSKDASASTKSCLGSAISFNHFLYSWGNDSSLNLTDLSFLTEKEQLQKALQLSKNELKKNLDIKKMKADLEKRALYYDYNCNDVSGDGNCFFYAIADQFRKLGRTSKNDIDVDTLRMLVSVEVFKNKERYQEFMVAGERKSFASNIARPGVWVGMIAAQAIARIKNLIIVIIPHDGSPPQVFKPRSATQVIVLGNEVDWHFQSLIPKGETVVGQVTNEELLSVINTTPCLDTPLRENNGADDTSCLNLSILLNLMSYIPQMGMEITTFFVIGLTAHYTGYTRGQSTLAGIASAVGIFGLKKLVKALRKNLNDSCSNENNLKPKSS